VTISSCVRPLFRLLLATSPPSMDTISRENNSMLPVGAIIVGVIALLLGGYSAITISKLNKTVAEQDAKMAKIEAVESAANQAASATETLKRQYNELRSATQAGFDTISPAIQGLQTTVLELKESMKKPAPPAGKEKDRKGTGEPPVAGPGEYVVKPGDASGAKIARDQGVSLGDLQAVNPGVDWNKLKIGQKLKLPKK
jgi:LysM repeat protein